MKGYKAFYFDMTCRPGRRIAHYEVGGEYEMDGSPSICVKGFHFCLSIPKVYVWYPERFDIRICEIESFGELDFDFDKSKYATNRLRIVREFSPKQIAGCLERSPKWMISNGVFNRIEASLDSFRNDPRLYPLWTGRHNKVHYPTRKERDALAERAEEWTKATDRLG